MSDTESNSSSSSLDNERKRKLEKKSKNKSEKKLKKHKKEKKKKSHKEKKRSRKESTDNEKISTINKPIAPPRSSDCFSDIDNATVSFGAALPPHLLNKTPTVIGPVIPKDILINATDKSNQSLYDEDHANDSENEQGTYGPVPILSGQEMTAEQIELEKRALELKMAAIDGISSTNADQTVREEWMLELPDVGLKGGLAALNNLKRGFHQGKERPDFSDRTSWTKTPQTEGQPETGTSKKSKDTLKKEAKALFNEQRDAEQEAMAKKHKKKHKRDKTLVEIHQDKLRKEAKKKAKELKERGEKPERRPFSRDIDLKLNKIDSNQTKQIVDKAKILDSKFSRGHTKYL